ncbi:MAG: zinc protease [Planctomycetota bacterium]|jgi:zinc protease
MFMKSALATLALALPLAAQDLSIPFEKHVLENGLEVILHEDHSDPVVAVYVYYHVGSAREVQGRSGFAHLFEHMMFQGSENVGDEQHFKKVQEAGGTLNGTTDRDRTLYYEVLPSNQMEMALWLEADRMGFLLPSVTEEKLENQREVVKNERRQNYDDRPYGREYGAWAKALYPAEHSYSWTTIGSHADLTAASLDDVHGFFRKWYGPNNATLAVGGDIDPKQALALIKKYYGSIPRGPEVGKPALRPAQLEQDIRVVIEDRVKFPQVTLSWHSTTQFSEDDAPLELLSGLLSANKASIFNKSLMIERPLASEVEAYQYSGEIAGSFHVTLRAKPGVDLDTLEYEGRQLLNDLYVNGVDEEQLARAKVRFESDAIRQLETVSSRTSRLAMYNTFFGDPDHTAEVLNAHLNVTADDIHRVLGRYIINQPAAIVSTVPEGGLSLAAAGRTPAVVAAEAALDRSIVPTPAPQAAFRSPSVWHAQLANGINVTGTKYTELPIAQLNLYVPAGKMYEAKAKQGISSITAELLNEGTHAMTTTELTEALDAIGARLSIRATSEEIGFSVNVLEKYLPQAVAILKDIVLTPRFDEEDFNRIKDDRLVSIGARGDAISSTSRRAFDRLMFGDTLRGASAAGTEASVSALTRDDVTEFWSTHGIAAGARMTFVGGLNAEELAASVSGLTSQWRVNETGTMPASFVPEDSIEQATPSVYLIDKPGAAQSQVRVGQTSVATNDPDYYPLFILNYILGGSFSSRINLNLREDKGYTYGARSNFTGGILPGTFVTSSGVRGDVTKESLVEIMKELNMILDGVTQDELDFTKKALIQSASRQYESIRALSGLLNDISRYGFADDYLEQRQLLLNEISIGDLKALARKHLTPDKMVILVVGDREKVESGLIELGYGDVTALDIDGVEIAD